MKTKNKNKKTLRKLSDREMRIIKNYNFSSSVKKRVIERWEEVGEYIPNSINLNVFNIFVNIIYFLFPVVLIINVFGTHFDFFSRILSRYDSYFGFILNCGLIFTWLLSILGIFYWIFRISLVKNDIKIGIYRLLSPWYLPMLRSQSILRVFYLICFRSTLLFGLLLNAYYMLSVVFILVNIFGIYVKFNIRKTILSVIKHIEFVNRK